jgi:ribosomal protein L12E/L44/L45/RPP1/RPP2
VAEGPSAEELAEQIRRLKIEDVVLSTVTTLGQLAYTKLETKDFAQARLAIDAIAALLGTLEGSVDAQLLRDFNQLLANVRLAFAGAVAASGSEPQTPAAETPSEPEPAAETETGDESVPEESQDSGSGSEPQTPDGAGNGDDG